MNQLKAKRFLTKKSQYQIALETGIFQSRISLIENGFVKPKAEEKKLLAESLEATLEELFPPKS